jgi:mannitol/fructose-specific phosphotransferase system IIA component (Ntr-type)
VKTPAKMITKECIVDLKGDTKQDVLMELIDAIARAPEITDKDDFFYSNHGTRKSNEHRYR